MAVLFAFLLLLGKCNALTSNSNQQQELSQSNHMITSGRGRLSSVYMENKIEIVHSASSWMGVYVITLPDRKKHVASFLRSINLEPEEHIFPAVLKTKLDRDNLIATGELDPHAIRGDLKIVQDELSMGEIACSLSHREVLKHFLQTNFTHAVVFEDDAVVVPDMMSVLEEDKGKGQVAFECLGAMIMVQKSDYTIMNLLVDLASTSETLGWHGLNLGRCWDVCHNQTIVHKVTAHIDIVKSERSLCTQSAIISRKGAEIHLRRTNPVSRAEDWVRQASDDFLYLSTQPKIFDQKLAMNASINGNEEDPECYEDCVLCRIKDN